MVDSIKIEYAGKNLIQISDLRVKSSKRQATKVAYSINKGETHYF